MRFKLIVTAIIAVVVGVMIWFFIQMNDWEHKCNEMGGTVDTRLEYYQTTYVQSGNTQIPVLTPIYSYHCMIDGQEVEVK